MEPVAIITPLKAIRMLLNGSGVLVRAERWKEISDHMDTEAAIDEAYGSWLGEGWADMKSYRDVFASGWRAGSEHEARNCPQEGRIVALRAEIEQLRKATAKTITFTCAECGEMFEESVQAFVDAPGESVMAPALCHACGHGDQEDRPEPSDTMGYCHECGGAIRRDEANEIVVDGEPVHLDCAPTSIQED